MDSFQETEAVHSRKGFFTNPAKVEFPYIPVQWRPSAPPPKFLHGKSTFRKKLPGHGCTRSRTSFLFPKPDLPRLPPGLPHYLP